MPSSIKNKIFIDTSGFYALLVKKDHMHTTAKCILQNAAKKSTTFITSDYIVDETATLLLARGLSHILPDFFEYLFSSQVCTIQWMDQDRFFRTKTFFIKHRDHHWSYTDCFSFILIKELHLRDVLTKDTHFRAAGFNPLLT